VAGVALFLLAIPCYEAVAPFALLLALGIPWLLERRISWPLVGATAAVAVAVLGWIFLHWHEANSIQGLTAVDQIWPAHFGWGIAPRGPVAELLAVLVLLAVVAIGYETIQGRARSPLPARLVGSGLAVLLVGASPFVLYYYGPIGGGDRFNFISAIGGALILTGVLVRGWAWRPAPVLVVVPLLLALALIVRAERVDQWDRAGNDAVAILAAVEERWPEPPERIVLGPTPVVEDNIAAFLDNSNVNAALRFRYDDPAVRAYIAQRVEDFEGVPESERLDIRPHSTLDG
jgi:hypothetical protein